MYPNLQQNLCFDANYFSQTLVYRLFVEPGILILFRFFLFVERRVFFFLPKKSIDLLECDFIRTGFDAKISILSIYIYNREIKYEIRDGVIGETVGLP